METDGYREVAVLKYPRGRKRVLATREAGEEIVLDFNSGPVEPKIPRCRACGRTFEKGDKTLAGIVCWDAARCNQTGPNPPEPPEEVKRK